MQVTRFPPIKQSRKLETVWIYGAWYAPYHLIEFCLCQTYLVLLENLGVGFDYMRDKIYSSSSTVRRVRTTHP